MTNPCLLIVDDEPEMAEYVGDVADGMGFDCVIATSAKDALDLYGIHKPIGIVMDVVMPDMDGIELVQALAALGCVVPIMVMSGYKKIYIDMIKALAANQKTIIVGGLSKPFRAAELEALLKQILETLD